MPSIPFHDGEVAVQEQTGEYHTALRNGRTIAGRIPPPAMSFITQQEYGVVGWASPEEEVWAALLAGARGFARSDQAGENLVFALSGEEGVVHQIPPLDALREGDPVGVLFIELATRRRLRVNGRASLLGNEGLAVQVEAAYALCPKYIQRRQAAVREHVRQPFEIRRGVTLDAALGSWITGADTFFVASAHPEGPADVSHRGGKPGFVHLRGGVLRIPDYPGNSMFNTLGNFALNPRAGLAFVDFAANRQLQMTGDVRLDLDAGEAAGETGGTGRWWEFTPRRWIVSPLNQAFSWELLEESPFNP